MAWETYDDTCPGCQPVLLNPKTGEKYPDDDPAVVAMNKVWSAMVLEERQAFHRVCCENSRDPEDIAVMQKMSENIKREFGDE